MDRTEDRKKIGAFIGYHNIIRPIEYPLFGLIFSSGLIIFLYACIFITPTDRPSSASISWLGLGISASMIIAGVFIRRHLLREQTNNPGKSLYYAQMILYVYCTIMGLLLLLFFENFEHVTNNIAVALIAVAVLIGVTLIVAYLFIRKTIIDGRYLEKKHISDKVIAFSASTGCMVLYLTVFQFMRRLMNVHGVVILTVLVSQVSAVLALIYYLKLRYAKKYGLEEYFPTRPNPSPYTNWE
jgi:cobalamin synthase